MKFSNKYFKLLLLMFFGLAVQSNYTMAQTCVTPVITSISNTSPACEGSTVTLNASGTVGGVSSGYVRMAGIGGNSGNQEFNVLFSSGDRPGSIARISNATFDAIFASASTDAGRATLLKAQYDVLMFTWASPNDVHITWSLFQAYLNLGGSIFVDGDYANITNLNVPGGVAGVSAGTTGGCAYTLVSPAPFPVLVNLANGCFANDHLYCTSWPSWMFPYITASGRALAIAGIYPSGLHGRLIIQGPDQDFHAIRGASTYPWGGGTGGNQYQIMLNQMDFLSANQAGFTWSGPGGFTSNDANPILSNVTTAMAGVYTATLTNTTGGGCYATATTTVTVNAAPATGTISGTNSIYAGQTSALSSTISGGTWSSSNTALATVSTSGVVTGVSGGSVVISYSKSSGGCPGYSTYAMTILSCSGPSTTFGYTGSVQSYAIPSGVTSVGVDLAGAGGGNGDCWIIGGKGGRVQCNLAVTPGEVLYFYVGGQGGNATLTSTPAAGGFNGGGAGSGSYSYGGGGGGGTDIRTSASGTTYTNRLIVGGGGGGTGYYYCAASDQGGDGGYPSGGSGIYGGTGSYYSSYNGAGGTQTAGGAGATSGGGNGGFGTGGNAAIYYYGGGGGGGYYGGGGAYIQGGGGGSSYVGGSGVSGVTTTSGYQSGNGYIKITLPLSVAITSQPTNATVCSGSSATFSVAATGPSLGYQWQVNTGSGYTNVSGATGNSLTVSAISTMNGNQYRCVVTGACGLSSTSSAATLTVADAPVITCTGNVTQDADAGACNAVVSYSAATATGTSPSFSYSQNSGTAFSVGVTTVTATATNSCGSDNCSFTITVNPNTLSVSTSHTNVSCNSANGGNHSNGSITTTVTGGTGSYSYSWTGGASGATPSGLAAGAYTVTVTDAGCSAEAAATAVETIGEPAAFTASATPTNVSCNASNGGNHSDGSMSLSYTNGVPAFSVTSGSTTSLGVGSNTVTITDATGCTTTATATIGEPAAFTASATPTNVSCNASNGGNHSDGSMSLSYTNGVSAFSVTSGSTTSLGVGSNTVTITDATGCTTTATATIGQPSAVTIAWNGTGGTTGPHYDASNTCASGSHYHVLFGYDLSLSVTAGGGTGTLTYNWNNGLGNNATNTIPTTGTAPTSYTVYVSDANGCTTATLDACDNDVRCSTPGNSTKTLMCRQGHTICVDDNAVTSQLASGATLGLCGSWKQSNNGNSVVATDVIKVYPNPTDGTFNVAIPANESEAVIQIADMIGRVIETRTITNNTGDPVEFNLNNVPQGIYFVRVKAGEMTSVSKLLVK
jgi:hypothetical protein